MNSLLPGSSTRQKAKNGHPFDAALLKAMHRIGCCDIPKSPSPLPSCCLLSRLDYRLCLRHAYAKSCPSRTSGRPYGNLLYESFVESAGSLHAAKEGNLLKAIVQESTFTVISGDKKFTVLCSLIERPRSSVELLLLVADTARHVELFFPSKTKSGRKFLFPSPVRNKLPFQVKSLSAQIL